jgi:hypothetical protein
MALRFETKKPGVAWTRVALDVAGAAAGGTMSSGYSGNAKVIALNQAGKHHVLEAVESEEVAEDRRTAIERDYDLLGLQSWCEKYNVPRRFAEE